MRQRSGPAGILGNRRRRLRAAGAVMILVAGGAAIVGETTASADEVRTLTARSAQPRKCHDRALTSGRGVAGFKITAPSTGLLRVRLDPANARDAESDWDVAVFNNTDHRVVAASAAFRSYEVGDGFVTAGDELWVQGCHYAGRAQSANVSVTFVATPPTPAGADDPVQVVAVDTPTRADKNKLTALDVDLAEAATNTTVDVVLHGKADAERLRQAGFTYTVKIPDLSAHVAKVQEADKHFRAAIAQSDLPSGRTGYRRLADYDYEMKDLARVNTQLVKTFVLSHRSVEGRDIGGVEIARNPANIADGKPIFLNVGVHHAREWPAGEHPMEWIYELLKGDRTDTRIRGLIDATRNIVIPVVNPDGFSVSREAPPKGDFSAFDYEMKRKNCSPDAPPPFDTGLCPQNPAGRTRGVDLNRNYAGFWGGPGASTNWRSDTFRGPQPFSEPESQALRELISARPVTNLITNHTYSNLVLRPPGVMAVGQPVDEPLLQRLGAQMADKNQYANIRGYELYDTTGSTEDWSYWVTGGLGYTFEIGPNDFHPSFADGVIAEYLGRAPAAGAGKGGNREAYLTMLESTANAAHHATITGQAPPGRTLRLRKEFQTPTSPVIQPDGTVGPAILFHDVIDNQIRPSGDFTWHVNPSTRPYVAGRYGRFPTAPPQAPLTLANPTGQPAENTGSPLDGPHEEVPFTVQGPPAADNGEVRVRIEWTSTDTDWDLYVVDAANHVVGQSANGGTNVEEAVMLDLPPGAYRAIMVNFAQVSGQPFDDWFNGSVKFASPKPPVQGVTESYTLTCERSNGSIVAVRQVIVGRGETVNVGDFCRRSRKPA